MKTIMVMILIVFLWCQKIWAQSDLFLNFNSTHSGRNLSLAWSKQVREKNEFGVGLRFNINKLAHPDDQNNVFKKRLYATKPYHYIGAEMFYSRKIFKIFSNIETFAFYNAQLSYSTTRNRDFLPVGYSIGGDALYIEYINIFGPFTWFEQNIGFGYKVSLASNWFLQHKMGFGTSFVMGYDKSLWVKYFDWFYWEFGYFLNVGIGYRFE